jgi:hypothetical protein
MYILSSGSATRGRFQQRFNFTDEQLLSKQIPKTHRDSHLCLFALLESGVNFINILRVPSAPKFLRQEITKPKPN